MATSSASSIPVTSMDLERISIITGSRVADTDEPGRGSIYDMTNLAAGRLFHVHRAEDAFLLSHSTIWKTATPAANAPGTYSAKTAYSRPTFWWVNPAADGSVVGAISGYDTPSGQLYPQGDGTLRISAATSMGDIVVYLGSHKGGTFLAFYRVAKGHTQLISTQWNTPMINANDAQVTWNRGVYGYPGQLMVIGAAPDKSLYLMKATIGILANQKSAIGGVGQTYLGAKGGWELYPGNAAPLRDAAGVAITSEGNVSMAHYRNQWLMSVVVDGGTAWHAKFYRALHPSHGWQEITRPTPVVLGPKTTDPLLCGAFLQDSLTPNSEHAELPSDTVRGGVLYTYTVEAASSLRTNWGVLLVPLGQM